MKHVLVLNVGSSSVKYSVFADENLLLKGNIERVNDFRKAIRQVMSDIKRKEIVIDAVAHRVVHGGTIAQSLKLNSNTLKRLDKVKNLAPLHNPHQIKAIKICRKLFKVPQVAVFDTAFHQTIPQPAHTYAIPGQLAKKHDIRRYGFHGTSHNYVAHEAARLIGRPIDGLKIITCHLGNGCSVTAVDGGVSIETSMGFTPLEGLVMGTRSGDIDPSICELLQRKERKTAQDVDELLNKRSGLLGICGKSDMRDIYAAAISGDGRARLALDVFCHRIVKYIGAYIAVLGGVNAIVFTGGIGEKAWYVREQVIRSFGHIGARLNKRANRANRHDKERISSSTSKVWLFAIPTREDLMMAREAKRILGI